MHLPLSYLPLIHLREDVVLLDAPHHPALVTAMRSRGLDGTIADELPRAGKGYQMWQFPRTAEAAVRALAVDIWGWDGNQDNPLGTVTVHYLIPDPVNLEPELWLFGRCLARRRDRRDHVTLGHGVTVVSGRFPNVGGTPARAGIWAEPGTVLQVTGVPAAHPDLVRERTHVTVLTRVPGRRPAAVNPDQPVTTAEALTRAADVAASVGTPPGLTLEHPYDLGAWLRVLLGWLDSDPAVLWAELPADQQAAYVTAAVNLFRAGAESADAWAAGWDACLTAALGALDDLAQPDHG